MWEAMQKVAYWLVEQFVIQVNFIFASIRGIGDLALSSMFEAISVYMPSTANVTVEELESYTETLNFFFPLTESIGFLVTYGSFWVLVVAYRAVKSWIPLVSGT